MADKKGKALKVVSIHWGFSMGGVGQYAALMDKCRERENLAIHSLCILSDRWQTDRKTLSRISPTIIHIRSRWDMSWIPAIASEIKAAGADLIFTHGFNGHFVALLTKRLSGHRIPLIGSYHGAYHAPSAVGKIVSPLLNRFTVHFFKKHASDVVAVAECTKLHLVEKGVDPHKITVVHNGIPDIDTPPGVRSALRSRWAIGHQDVLVGIASRLDPVKGVAYLIDGIAPVMHEMMPVKLMVVGTGSQETMLKERVKRHGIENRVIFAGFRNDVDRLLAAFDIFALPSLAEYHSIALLEAMRAGKAIVATDVGGNTESVRHAKEGLIVPAADSGRMGRAIRRLAADPDLRRAFGARARHRFMTHFTQDQMIEKSAAWIVNCGRNSKGM